MTGEIILHPIGKVVSERKDAVRDDWDNVAARIELDPAQFAETATQGIETFSHIEVVFHFHLVRKERIESDSRHPRNNPAWPKVGIFAQRGKNRPNLIGTTVCRLLKKEELTLHVEGLDAIDGTPVLDIKPWVAAFGARGPAKEPEWMAELMVNYWRRQK